MSLSLEIGALMDDIDLPSLQSELRGITDCVEDSQYDHWSKIPALIAAAAAQKTIKRPDQQKNYMDYESSHRLIRHHMKVRQTMFGNFNLFRGELPIDKTRLTGKRITTVSFKGGTSKIVTDDDYRTLPKPCEGTKDWTGKTEFEMTPLASDGTSMAAPKVDSSYKRRLRRKLKPGPAQQIATQQAQPATLKAPHPPPASLPTKSVAKPPPPKTLSGDSKSQGAVTKMVIEETERSILNRIRSIKEFNHSTKDELARLFYTPDPLTGQERTTDYWLQLPMYWIRMIHTKRTNLVHPDDEPSPIESTNPSAFGDMLLADRHTYIIESHNFQSPTELRLVTIGVMSVLLMALNKGEKFIRPGKDSHFWIDSYGT